VPLLAVFVLGSACLASLGTLFAAMSNNMRLRELLLPLLLLPMILPALISCVAATKVVLANGHFTELLPHMQMLGVYTVVFTVLSLMLFEYVIEE
jgi:heme exporter protein B